MIGYLTASTPFGGQNHVLFPAQARGRRLDDGTRTPGYNSSRCSLVVFTTSYIGVARQGSVIIKKHRLIVQTSFEDIADQA